MILLLLFSVSSLSMLSTYQANVNVYNVKNKQIKVLSGSLLFKAIY